MIAIELVDIGQFMALPFITDFRRWIEVKNRVLAGQELRSLMSRRHKSGAPDSVTTRWFAITIQQDNETRQIIVLITESVIDPRAETRAAGKDAAGVHLSNTPNVVQGI